MGGDSTEKARSTSINYAQFLPLGHRPYTGGPGRPKPHPGQDVDPERAPQRELARKLGNYGSGVLERIKAEYEGQREIWEAYIGRIVTEFQKALGQHEHHLKKNEAEQNEKRRQEAELKAFVFSLITAGVARWAGTFVQYKIYPKLFSGPRDKYIRFTDTNGLKALETTIRVTETDYNKQMAAFLGGLTQDAVNGSVDYLAKKANSKQDARRDGASGAEQSPYYGVADDDHATFARVTEGLLLDALKSGTQVVGEQIDRAKFWMIQQPAFGEAWAAKCNFNEAVARNAILAHLQDVRDFWARKWPYFGRIPGQIHPRIAEAFERSLWSSYIDGYLGQFARDWSFNINDLFSRRLDDRFKPKDRNSNFQTYHRRFVDALGIGRAIVNRLKHLNVVVSETPQGRTDQKKRADDRQAPQTTATVAGEVDSLDEMRELWRWAREYPFQWAALARQGAVDPSMAGTPRNLEPLSQP